jgi:magnesium transporter
MPTDYHRSELLTQLEASVARDEPAALVALLAELHAADLADFFADLSPDTQARILEVFTDEQAAALLGELAPEDRAGMLDLLSVERTPAVVGEMYSDDAADLLAELPTGEADALLERMEPDAADEVAELLRYHEDTAGGLMAKEFVRLAPEQRVDDVLALLRRNPDDAEMIYALFVLDEADRLLGVVSLRQLLVSTPAQSMAELMVRETPSVTLDTPHDEVADLVRRHRLLALPVLDAGGRMHGIITVDDVGDVVEEQAAEELLEVGGAEEPPAMAPAFAGGRGWRSGLIALFGGSLCTGMVWGEAQAGAPLAVLAGVPVMLALGLTSSTQTALTLDHAYEEAVERGYLPRLLLRELLAGVVLALASGAVIGGVLWMLPTGRGIATLVAGALALGLGGATGVSALGVLLIRRRGDLGPATHVTLIVLAVIVAVAVYLLTARWSTPGALPHGRG